MEKPIKAERFTYDKDKLHVPKVSQTTITGKHLYDYTISDAIPTKFQMFLYRLNPIKRNKEKRRVMKFYDEILTDKHE